MNTTPRSNRLHIVLLGCRNAGKSSLMNALTHQQVSVVSDVPGTTTDPVSQSMEIHGIGPCVFIDTPGFDDQGILGDLRVSRTSDIVGKADIVLLVSDKPEASDEEMRWVRLLRDRSIPFILVCSKADKHMWQPETLQQLAHQYGEKPICVSAHTGQGLDAVCQALVTLSAGKAEPDIVAHLVAPGDVVLLVMPQDAQAPKGRLILPQVQTLRELLDKHCVVTCCATAELEQTLQALSRPPKLIVTDSQAFHQVYPHKPKETLLTSFSVLFARHKGDIDYYVQSVQAIGRLTSASSVLIAEACTHAPLTEDIGRVKIPRLLRKRVGEQLQIDVVSGADFPSDLSAYDLVIHCGGCMFNRQHMLTRVAQARQQGVPMTNYGITIAWLNGILDKVVW